MQNTVKNIKLVSLVMLFVLPIFAAIGVYMGRDFFNFTPKTFGTLITPPLSIEHAELKTVDGTAVEPFGKTWWMIYVAPPECGDECAVQAAKLRSVHMALNANIPRVKRLLLLQTNSLPADQITQAAQDEQATIDFIQNPEYLLKGCPTEPALQEGIFIMDPLGNIMLCYQPQQEAHAVLQDIEKLLKASQIG